MIDMENLPELWEIDHNYIIDNDEDYFSVIVNGKRYPAEMTLSLEYDDAHCMRVMIDGVYYYFG